MDHRLVDGLLQLAETVNIQARGPSGLHKSYINSDAGKIQPKPGMTIMGSEPSGIPSVLRSCAPFLCSCLCQTQPNTSPFEACGILLAVLVSPAAASI